MYRIDETKMIVAAKNSLTEAARKRPLFIDFLIFMLVATISSVPQTLISTAYSYIKMLTDPKYYEIVMSESFDTAEVLEYVMGFFTSYPSWIYALMLAASGFMIVCAIFYCKKFEKRGAFTLGFNKRCFFTEYLGGACKGLSMISIPTLACILTGCVTFTFNKNANPLMIALFFVAFLLQGMGEEALFRGYFMTSLARRYNQWPAIIISALIFAAFHAGNANFSIIAFINITLFGIFAGVFMLKRGSIWAIGGIHAIWNFAQSNIWGLNVSGNPKFDSLFVATDNGFGSILSGGEFGLEGGLGVTVVLLVAILISLLTPTKKCELAFPKKEETENQ